MDLIAPMNVASSNIRETMVKLMMSPATTPERQGAVNNCAEAGDFGANPPEQAGGTLVGPSACIFWCTIALGALAKGSPIESVRVGVSPLYRKTRCTSLRASGVDALLSREWAEKADMTALRNCQPRLVKSMD